MTDPVFREAVFHDEEKECGHKEEKCPTKRTERRNCGEM